MQRLQEDEGDEEEDTAHWKRGLREQRWGKGHVKMGVEQHEELAWRSAGSGSINCIIK